MGDAGSSERMQFDDADLDADGPQGLFTNDIWSYEVNLQIHKLRIIRSLF